MKVIHQIGDRSLGGNFNSLEEIVDYNGPISFDGVYESVYETYKKLKGKDITFFFCHDHLGKDNSFDVGQPLSRFCTWDQIVEMAEYLGAKIGYHGRLHRSCPKLSDIELRDEIYPPKFWAEWCREKKQVLMVAWPYGDVDQACQYLAASWYTEAWSVYPKGDGSQFQKNRYFLNWDVYHANGELALKAFT